MAKEGCNSTKWKSNSSEFLKNKEPSGSAKTRYPTPQPQKVFGLTCNTKTDCLVVDKKLYRKFEPEKETTQLKLLKFVVSLFDPLRTIASMAIRVRKVLQVA